MRRKTRLLLIALVVLAGVAGFGVYLLSARPAEVAEMAAPKPDSWAAQAARLQPAAAEPESKALAPNETQSSMIELTAAAVPGRENRVTQKLQVSWPVRCALVRHELEILDRRPYAPLHFVDDGYTTYTVKPESFWITLTLVARNTPESPDPHVIRLRLNVYLRCEDGVKLEFSHRRENFEILETLPDPAPDGFERRRNTGNVYAEASMNPDKSSGAAFESRVAHIPPECEYVDSRIEKLVQLPPPLDDPRQSASTYTVRLMDDGSGRIKRAVLSTDAHADRSPTGTAVISANFAVDMNCRKKPAG